MQKRFVLVKKENSRVILYDRKTFNCRALDSDETKILINIYEQGTPYVFTCWCVKKEKFLLKCLKEKIIIVDKGEFFLGDTEVRTINYSLLQTLNFEPVI
ncbi:MAG: hypothetical protein WC546_03595 [Candidatus Omnitrophota bacterium]|jgi:hypothetical protein